MTTFICYLYLNDIPRKQSTEHETHLSLPPMKRKKKCKTMFFSIHQKLTKTTMFVLIVDAAFKIIFWIQICDVHSSNKMQR